MDAVATVGQAGHVMYCSVCKEFFMHETNPSVTYNLYVCIYIFFIYSKISQASYIRNQTQKDDNNFQFAKHVSDIALSIFTCYNTKSLNRTH